MGSTFRGQAQPEFPVTIIPRKLVRDKFNKKLFEDILMQIILNCDQLYKEEYLLFDLGTPDVSQNISYSVRHLLTKPYKFLSLKEFSIKEGQKKPQFICDVNDYTFLIHRIFLEKNYRKIKNLNKWSPLVNNTKKVRHWYQLDEKNHAAKILQPRDIPTIIRLFNLSQKNQFLSQNYYIEKISKFLAIMIVTNLISQIAHHSKFKLRDTFGKNIIFPEIVGDCLSCCHLHFRPTEYPSLILKEIKSEFGEEICLKLREHINKKIHNLTLESFIYLDELLNKLVYEEDLEACSKKIQVELLNHDIRLH